MSTDYTWVVDPIDGTTNFTRDRHWSCISIALLKEKQPILGMIYNPYADELFLAIKGEGATLNGNTIHVSENKFEQSVCAVGTSPYYASLVKATCYCVEHFISEGGDIRRCGSAALDLTDVACGRADVFAEMLLSPWDFAAGALLVQEAGGYFAQPLQ